MSPPTFALGGGRKASLLRRAPAAPDLFRVSMARIRGEEVFVFSNGDRAVTWPATPAVRQALGGIRMGQEISVRKVFALGQSSSYATISDTINDLVVAQAGVSVVGQATWDQAYSGIFDAINAGNGPVSAMDDWQTTMSKLGNYSSQMMVTTSYTPPDIIVQAAAAYVTQVTSDLNYVLQQNPSLTSAVQLAQSQASTAVTAAPPIQNPSQVGQQAFNNAVAANANAILNALKNIPGAVIPGLPDLSTLLLYIAIGAAGLVGILLISKFG